MREAALHRSFAKRFKRLRSLECQSESVEVLWLCHHPAFGDSTSVE